MSSGRAFVLPDLRLPSSVKDVGFSASNFFHGGDIGFGFFAWDPGGGVDNRGRLAGLDSESCEASPSVDASREREWLLASSSSDLRGVRSESLSESADFLILGVVSIGSNSGLLSLTTTSESRCCGVASPSAGPLSCAGAAWVDATSVIAVQGLERGARALISSKLAFETLKSRSAIRRYANEYEYEI